MALKYSPAFPFVAQVMHAPQLHVSSHKYLCKNLARSLEGANNLHPTKPWWGRGGGGVATNRKDPRSVFIIVWYSLMHKNALVNAVSRKTET